MKKHIIRTHAKIKERGWEKLYYAVDIHDTVIKANYCNKELPQEFFPLAKEVLQSLSNRDDAVLILFTCSHTADIAQYLTFFARHEIHFDYVNENPEVQTLNWVILTASFMPMCTLRIRLALMRNVIGNR